MNVDTLIQRLNEFNERDSDPREPIASQTDITATASSAEANLGHKLPTKYLSMLLEADGFHYNGLFFLASRTRPITGRPDAGDIMGIVEDNLDYWEVGQLGWVVMGYDEASAYAYDANDEHYLRFWRVAESIYRKYDTFEEMLADALDSAGVSVSDLTPAGFQFSRMPR